MLAQEGKSLTSEVLIFTRQGTAIHLYSINATEGALQTKTTQNTFFTILKRSKNTGIGLKKIKIGMKR